VERLSLGDSEDVGINTQADAPVPLAEDEVTDFITGRPVKLKGNEEVRQRIARALFHEYGISTWDMETNFPIPVSQDGQRRATKKADIAIFERGTSHTPENLRRVVICKPEPKGGRVTKVRTFEQAGKDLDELTTLLGTEATPKVEYGMWTNGLDFFFLQKEVGRFSATFTPRAVGSAAAPRRGRNAQDGISTLP
jgi:type I restriction enzyme M protein